MLLIALLVAVAGALIRLGILTRGGGLLGSDAYDDGVYYAAADALVHGRIPYRDFLLLQPPGVVLALSPFAALGAVLGDPVGVATARLAFIALGGVNCALVALILRRYGATAALVGGGFAAVFFPLAYSEHSTLLEPVATFAALVALLLLPAARAGSPRAALGMGVAVGCAMDVRIWFVVPAAILVVAARRRWWALLGAGAALAAAYVPFLIADPASTVRQVLIDQLGRPRVHVTVLQRIDAITGAPTLPAVPGALVSPTDLLGLVLLAALGVAAWTAWRRGERMWVVLLVAGVAVLEASPSWFLRYAALTAPVIALIVGLAVATLLGRVRRALRPAGALAALVIVGALSWQGDTATVAVPEPLDLAPAVAAIPGCVLADDPATLAALGVLSRDLESGCRVRVDPTGYTYDRDATFVAGRRVARGHNPRWQADIVGYLESGAAFLQVRHDLGLDVEQRQAPPDHRQLVVAEPARIRIGGPHGAHSPFLPARARHGAQG
ncbi:MAG: hypothetical protein ACTHJL_14580, partial [Amnibacterium sp.]